MKLFDGWDEIAGIPLPHTSPITSIPLRGEVIDSHNCGRPFMRPRPDNTCPKCGQPLSPADIKASQKAHQSS